MSYKKLNIYLPEDVYEKLRTKSFRDKISMSQIIKEDLKIRLGMIEKLMDKDPEHNSKEGKKLVALATDVEVKEEILYPTVRHDYGPTGDGICFNCRPTHRKPIE